MAEIKCWSISSCGIDDIKNGIVYISDYPTEGKQFVISTDDHGTSLSDDEFPLYYIEAIQNKIYETKVSKQWADDLYQLFLKEKEIELQKAELMNQKQISSPYDEYMKISLQIDENFKNGKYDENLPLCKHLLDEYPSFQPERVMYNIACIYSLSNSIDLAFEWLEDAVNKGYNDWEHALQDQDFNNIKDDERFIKLIEKVKSKYVTVVDGVEFRLVNL